MRTRQEIFDTVAAHLLAQGVRATDAEGRCQYRGANGTRCAIGCLIPDNRYDAMRFEGESCDMNQSDAEVAGEILDAAGVSLSDARLAAELQNIHDNEEPEGWSNALRGVAMSFGLSVAVL